MKNNFFKNVIKKLGVIFGKIFKQARTWSAVSVKATQALKAVVENPAMDFLVALTTFTDLDDKGLALAELWVPKIANKVGVIHGILSEDLSDADALVNIIEYLRTINPSARADFWVRITTEVTIALSDGKLTFAEAGWISQLVYAEMEETD